MKEFKVGDQFVYCPGNEVCLLKITEIEVPGCNNDYKVVKFNKYTYVNNTYDDGKYETGTALIIRDEEKGKEYVQVDYWMTHKYCVRHIIYCE